MSIHPEQHPLDGKLEPETKDCFNDRAPLYSIAISLKRIADAPSEAAARITELEGDLKTAHAFSLPDSPSADAGSHPRLADQAHAAWNRRSDGARGGEPVALGAYRSEFLRWRDWCRDWSESAFLAGEPMTKWEVSDNTSQLYSDLCRLGIHLDTWAHEALASPADPSGWRPIDQAPDLGRKIVALYGDGSGASMFWRHDGGYIDADGDEWGELPDHYALWTYLPDSFQFWCEYRSDEPMTLTLPPTSEGGGARAPTHPEACRRSGAYGVARDGWRRGRQRRYSQQ